MKIKDITCHSMANVRFVYPGDGQKYYWASQWGKGVWGKKHPSDERLYPLFCADLSEAAEWEVVEEKT